MKRVLKAWLLVAALALGIYNNLSPSTRTRLQEAWKQLTLPYRLLKLASQPADEQLVMPVEGASVSTVANTWGAARSGDRLHQGQDIFAPRGTPVYSATHGIVTRMTNQGIGGIAVFVTGAGGRRYYYAHLDRYAELIRVGDNVTPHTIIGYVGNTGNARGTPPHLHFGVYGPKGALDPLPLLADRDLSVGETAGGKAARVSEANP